MVASNSAKLLEIILDLLLGARREPTTNSAHMSRRVRESNPSHRGGGERLSNENMSMVVNSDLTLMSTVSSTKFET